MGDNKDQIIDRSGHVARKYSEFEKVIVNK